MNFKIQLRIENEKYLRSHPELSIIIKDFLKYFEYLKDFPKFGLNRLYFEFREVYINKPENVKEFAAGILNVTSN